jgi:hypothetical protein
MPKSGDERDYSRDIEVPVTGSRSRDSEYVFPSSRTGKSIGDIKNASRATLKETCETFFLNLSGTTNATIADTQGLSTILNDE